MSWGTMSILSSFNIKRFIIIAICVTVAVIGLNYLWSQIQDADETIFTTICFILWLLVSGPMIIAELISIGSPLLSTAIFWVGCVVTGLVWAFIVEWLCMKTSRKKTGNAPEQTTTVSITP